MAPNRLVASTSPYLLQHAENPVDWMPWGPEALERARTENRPILLSIGYAACHWCHVMAHESFENPAIAEVMNERFVNIKVDREERPDIDHIYMSALSMTGQPGGWPLTMFLTPAGEPFWGGTYFPAEARYGRPGFVDVLKTVSDIYHQDPQKVTANVTALRDGLSRLSENRIGDAVPPGVPIKAAERLATEIDQRHGGIGTAPKFPQVSALRLLWTAGIRADSNDCREGVLLTARRLCQGGIYDHLGGGFARYAVDEAWLVPHFEKMLYDNAQIIDLLTDLWLESREPLFEARVRETVGWIEREMLTEEGAFAASLDADSEGEEGLFYVWDQFEIDDVLGQAFDDDAVATFKNTYNVAPGGNWEGRTILNRGQQPGLADGPTEAMFGRMRDVLLAARAKRTRPGWDDKILTDWNGLMIASLAGAARVFNQPAWLSRAESAYAVVRSIMSDGDRLYHAARRGTVQHQGMLSDYVAMARAALKLFEITGNTRYLDDSRRWLEVIETHFHDGAKGGYFQTADDAETLIVRTKSVYDNAEPSGNGLMLDVLARLFHMTGDRRYGERAEALMQAFSGELEHNFLPMTSYLTGVDTLYNAAVAVILGDDDEPETMALVRAALDSADPACVVMHVAQHGTLPADHPAAGKTRIDGKPTAYVCRALTCGPPLTDVSDVRAALHDTGVGS